MSNIQGFGNEIVYQPFDNKWDLLENLNFSSWIWYVYLK